MEWHDDRNKSPSPGAILAAIDEAIMCDSTLSHDSGAMLDDLRMPMAVVLVMRDALSELHVMLRALMEDNPGFAEDVFPLERQVFKVLATAQRESEVDDD